MVVEEGLVPAIEDRVWYPPAQQAANQALGAQVRALELGGETEKELPQVDVSKGAPHGYACQRGAELVGLHGDRASLERAELLMGPAYSP